MCSVVYLGLSLDVLYPVEEVPFHSCIIECFYVVNYFAALGFKPRPVNAQQILYHGGTSPALSNTFVMKERPLNFVVVFFFFSSS